MSRPAPPAPKRGSGLPRQRPRRHVVVVLAADDFDRLAVLAEKDARDPFQQARVLILRALDAEEGVAS